MVSAKMEKVYVVDETSTMYKLTRFFFKNILLRRYTAILVGLGFMLYDVELICECIRDLCPDFEMPEIIKMNRRLVTPICASFFVMALCFVELLSVSKKKPHYIPQKVRNGSDLIAPSPVPFQGMIKTCEGRLVGQFFRYNRFFITAAHVVESFNSTFIMVHGDKAVMVNPSDFHLMDGDLAVMPIPPGFALATMPSCKLIQNFPLKNSGLFVSVRSETISSVGLLEPDDAFGFVRYSGSTIGGFSGAPYTSGKNVYGMHLGGGAINMGLDSAYICMMLCKFNESSEDYFLDQIKRHSKLFYQRSPYDPDEYRVRSGNSYHLVSGDVMAKLLGTGFVEYEGESTIDRPPVRINIPSSSQPKVASQAQRMTKEAAEDFLREEISLEPRLPTRETEVIEINLPISKNSMRPQYPDADAGENGLALDQVTAPLLSSIPKFQPESVSLSPKPDMTGPTQTLVQPSAALNGTLGNMSELQNLLTLHLMTNLVSSLNQSPAKPVPLSRPQGPSTKKPKRKSQKAQQSSTTAQNPTNTRRARRRNTSSDSSRSPSRA